MVRGGAAAPPQNSRAVVQEGGGTGGEFLRPHVKDRLPVHQPGQTGIGLNHYRQMGGAEQIQQGGTQLPRTHGAVEAHYVRPQRGEGHGGGGGVHSQKGPAVLTEGHSHKDRQACPLPGGQQGGLRFQQIAHRLNEHQIRPGLRPRLHNLGKHLIGLVKTHLAVGLQQGPQRAYIQRHTAVRPRGTAGQGHTGGDIGGRVLPQLPPAGPKGVGGEDVRPGSSIGGVNFLYRLRGSAVQPLRGLPGLQAGLLQHRAHASVKEAVDRIIKHSLSAFPVTAPYARERRFCIFAEHINSMSR